MIITDILLSFQNILYFFIIGVRMAVRFVIVTNVWQKFLSRFATMQYVLVFASVSFINADIMLCIKILFGSTVKYGKSNSSLF